MRPWCLDGLSVLDVEKIVRNLWVGGVGKRVPVEEGDKLRKMLEEAEMHEQVIKRVCRARSVAFWTCRNASRVGRREKRERMQAGYWATGLALENLEA